MDKEIFVQNVRKYCSLRGVKPTVACRESGAGRSLLTNLEQNGSLPSVEKVQKLATYLGVTTSELLGEKIDPTLVVVRGLNKDQQELVRLYNGAPSELRREALKMLRSAVRYSKGAGDGQVKVRVKGLSNELIIVEAKGQGSEVAIEGIKGPSSETIIAGAKGQVNELGIRQVKGHIKRRGNVQNKGQVKWRGRGRGGPARGR